MKKMIITAVCTALLTGCTLKPETSHTVADSSKPDTVAKVHYTQNEMPCYDTVNHAEQKAVWLSYIDMASFENDTPEQFSADLSAAFDRLCETGFNTVYFHVRPFADSCCRSKLFPPSAAFPTDKNGELLYDPLKIAVNTAHKRGLSIHAWINPLRCGTAADMERFQGYELYDWYAEPDIYTEYMSSPDSDPHYWLDPAIPEVREYIAEGVRELCEYDIDGIHIDDYFYPTCDPSFDRITYEASGTELSLEEWRLENCSELVKLLYDTVKSCDEDLLFGVSPQGNIGNNYTFMYADVKRWCSEEGFADYIAPQIYFGYEDPVCPFEKTLEEWRSLCTADSVSLVCGLAMYKVGNETYPDFSEEGIISRQINDCKNLGYDGFAVYSSGNLLDDSPVFAAERRDIMAMLTK